MIMGPRGRSCLPRGREGSRSHSFLMRANSSTMLLGPMMMGPPSAMIDALGCTTVPVPIVTSPWMLEVLHTMAPGSMVRSGLALLDASVEEEGDEDEDEVDDVEEVVEGEEGVVDV